MTLVTGTVQDPTSMRERERVLRLAQLDLQRLEGR